MRPAEKATLVFNHKFLEYPTNYFVSTKIDEILNKTPSKMALTISFILLIPLPPAH